ncbi:arylesterase [Biformimicrobium ophioploci]|uniref:Arylesterase n=1 Tax=Biformimicrobium ophioploci TaxID=3036711 RepID=A0ABQ6LZW0_9GAMM|nr:arylesterase [Microbulbifer sp. NKW57]GMG87621.1 arylesterase [Microbulbifer sp. NKW57]
MAWRKRLRVFIVAFCVFGAPLGIFSAQGWASDQESVQKLLVLGDSISAGYGIDPEKGWVQLLQNRIREVGADIEVVNASVSGDTTRAGLARLPLLLKTHEPRWLVVELGGNDGLRGYPPKLMQENLDNIVARGKAANAQVLLLGMRLPPNYGPAYNEAFENAFVKVAEKQQVPFVPFFLETVALQEGALQSDGIHPTQLVQAGMLDYVWPCLNAMLNGNGQTKESCNF